MPIDAPAAIPVTSDSDRRERPIVVLHHGVGSGTFKLGPWRHRYFRQISDRIAERHPVILSNVHPTAGIARRAQQLKDTIIEQTSAMGCTDKRVVVIGHSMGGLDARYMIAKIGMENRVSALVSVTTPHRGSPYADWCLRHLGQRLGGIRLFEMLGADIGALYDLTTESCARFNEEIPDVPGVRYFSVSAARPWHKIPAVALHAYRLIYGVEGPNDGLVSVQSSTWAQHLTTWAADHWHTINHRALVAIREKLTDIAPLYLRVLDDIAGQGATAV